ncbi:MAG TPA: hypothetical protein VHL77_02330, partial [Ferruginibacter sp.]|nr:hypothetical protein [Ferruginibacter sp.]
MKRIIQYGFFCGLIFITACTTSRQTTSANDNGKIDITFLQINDVYEIAPLDGGKAGGMARVATIKQDLLKENPNT